MSRTIRAFLLAPLPLPLVHLLYLLVLRRSGYGAVEVTAEIILPVSYFTLLIAGVPTFWLLRWMKLASVFVFLAWGLFLGIAGSFIFSLALGYDPIESWASYFRSPLAHLLEHLWGNAVEIWSFGIVAGLTFWMIARPDDVEAPEV